MYRILKSILLGVSLFAGFANAQSLAIKAATVIDPKSDNNQPKDISIKDGKIVSSETTQPAGADAIFLISPKNDPRIGNRKFEQVPSVATSADGKQLFAAWYSGGDAPGPGNYVTVALSTDQGKTWKNDQLIVFPKEPTTRFFDPGLWRDKYNQLHLIYGSSKNGVLFDGKGGVNSLDLKWDGTKIAYSKPTRLADGVMSNKPVYVSSKDLQLLSLYIDKPATANPQLPQYGAFVLSHSYKNGRDLTFLGYSSVVVPDEIKIHDEPQLVQISDKGEFLCLVRTTKGIYYSKSTDFAKTWSAIEPFTAAGLTTSSRFSISKLKSGNLLLVMNASTTRNNMTAFLSKDGGKTWPYKLLLDARENVSYPDADQTANGNIHVVFDRDRTGAKDILYCRFSEKDLISGAESAVLKTKVNKP